MEQVPSIQATLVSQTQCKLMTRATTALFFRDELSRTRVEQGGLASIHDPASGQSFTLDPVKKIAIPGMPKIPGLPLPQLPKIPGVNLPKVPGLTLPKIPGLALPKIPGVQIPGVQAPQVSGVQVPQPPKETANLGEMTIDGIKVSGKQLSIPVPGKLESMLGEVWTSKDLKLPIQSKMTDPSTGCVMTTQMKNVQSGMKLDPTMFQVPSDFKIVAPKIPPAPQLKTGP
jgi:hypothetical protein